MVYLTSLIFIILFIFTIIIIINYINNNKKYSFKNNNISYNILCEIEKIITLTIPKINFNVYDIL